MNVRRKYSLKKAPKQLLKRKYNRKGTVIKENPAKNQTTPFKILYFSL